MQIDGAIIREQGLTFAIVVVKRHVLEVADRAYAATASFARHLRGMPIILMAQDASGRATYFGRRDIVRFLSGVSASRIPWKRYTFN